MAILIIVLLVLAAICFAAAALGAAVRINLVAAGLFCWVLATLLGVVAGHVNVS